MWHRNRTQVSLILTLVMSSLSMCPVEGRAQGSRKTRQRSSEDSGGIVARQILWRTNLAAALAEGAAVGKPILADFTADWCGFCKKLDATTFQDPAVIQFVNANYIPVKVDADNNTEAKEHYKVQGLPSMLTLKPDGDLVNTMSGYRDAEKFLIDARSAVGAVGSLVPQIGAERMQRTMATATKLMERERYASAYATFKQLTQEDEKFPEVEQAKEQMEKIESAASERLSKATAAVESKDFGGVAESLQEIVTDFAGTPAAEEAKSMQMELRRNPDAQRAMRLADAEASYARSLSDLEENRYGIAFTRLQSVVDEYGDLAISREASAKLDELESDPKIVQQVRDGEAEAQCNRWLDLARSWQKNKRQDRASEYFQKIVDTFPESSFAENARKELRRIEIEESLKNL